MPVYQHATYANEEITLSNAFMTVKVYKRATGWGWAEIFTPAGKCMGILDHFGELLLRDQEIPMRLEGDRYERSEGESGQTLTFPVQSLIVKDKLRNTSFDPWLNYPIEKHSMTGTTTLTLLRDQPVLRISMRFMSHAIQWARYVRGPWLKVGEGSFGTAKTDAIFPGVEWLEGDEWSSGKDWFKDPWAKRFAPHPNKVAIPLIALSHEGDVLSLCWDPRQEVSGWFNYRRSLNQPVFASPNFIDRANNHLLGLMIPDAEIEALENQVEADPGLELHMEQRIAFDGEVVLSRGSSLEAVTDWVAREGMPAVPEPRWPLEEALARMAEGYNTHFWHEGEGFGTRQVPQHGPRPYVPRFLTEYLGTKPDGQLAGELREKMDWCRERQKPGPDLQERQRQAEELLAAQREDGSFPFDPHGRHYRKDDFVVATTFLEPMGLAGDTALDITILPVIDFLTLWEESGEERFREGARKALDYCLPLQRPEGGDFWETPLHAPNLFAAGHAAVAYELGYRVFGDERYRERAIHWIRSLLPFTHLWDPARLPMIYNTKPCLCSSDWFFANWVRDQVQWEVLETFNLSQEHGIRWHEVDPGVDWKRYRKGVTVAAMRWMLDAKVPNWLPHNIPSSYALYKEGKLDLCFADTHNTTTGNYGGAGIMPDAIGLNILAILAEEAGSEGAL